MAVIGRIKGEQGVGGPQNAITPTTAVAFPILDEMQTYVVSGTTQTIPSIATTWGIQPGRTITFLGAAGCSIIFTNTPATATEGLMDLGVDHIKLRARDSFTIMQNEVGAWVCINYRRNPNSTATTGNALGATAVATGALTLPDQTDVFVMSAAAATTLSGIVTTKGICPGRRVLLQTAVDSANSVVLTNNAGSTTNGQFDVGAGDLTLAVTDSAWLMQGDDGVWRLIGTSNI